ncbi:hypothetical protein LTR95_014285, partial [Oleoguttula sp. CCFEE 5521]
MLFARILGMATLSMAFVRPHLPSYLNRREVSINSSDYPAFTIGPVFYFDAGEQNARPLVPYFLYDAAGPSSPLTLARRFGGIALIFEHRFYGDVDGGSLPFVTNKDGYAIGGYEAYKYLNTEQSLQDPVYFAHNFEPPGLEPYWSLLNPKYMPWIWLGGSYP